MEGPFSESALSRERLGAEDYVMEYQIESERGILVMGSRLFTENALMPLDPAHYSSLDGEALGSALTDYEIPDESWVWLWSRWYVDMTADVDDHGWCYSWRFRSRHWRGHHRILRSFVRQRMWKRPRIKRAALARLLAAQERDPLRDAGADGPEDDALLDAAAEPFQQVRAELLRALEPCRNDREKVDAILKYMEEHPGEADFFSQSRDFLMGTLMFPVSRKALDEKVTRRFPELSF